MQQFERANVKQRSKQDARVLAARQKQIPVKIGHAGHTRTSEVTLSERVAIPTGARCLIFVPAFEQLGMPDIVCPELKLLGDFSVLVCDAGEPFSNIRPGGFGRQAQSLRGLLAIIGRFFHVRSASRGGSFNILHIPRTTAFLVALDQARQKRA